MTSGTLEAALKAKAAELGFSLVGVCSPEPSQHIEWLRSWLAAGHHGEMRYMAREESLERRADLSATLPEIRSVVVVGMEYGADGLDTTVVRDMPLDSPQAVIARYAQGTEYHEVMETGLTALLAWLDGEVSRGAMGRVYVDTGPILERELGRRAGFGWFGRNTMLIHPRRGSLFVLGVLLTDAELEPDAPFTEDRCGTCRACLDACPTGALLGRTQDGAPVMDARRCISYLTIELKGPIPRELRAAIGVRVFGCDICQEVCPFNRSFAGSRPTPALQRPDGEDAPSLIGLTSRLLGMSEKRYQREFAASPLARPRRRGMLRNLCVALGNWGHEDAIPVLAEALQDDQRLVRGHAAWALGRIATPAAYGVVDARLAAEEDEWVREELELARGS